MKFQSLILPRLNFLVQRKVTQSADVSSTNYKHNHNSTCNYCLFFFFYFLDTSTPHLFSGVTGTKAKLNLRYFQKENVMEQSLKSLRPPSPQVSGVCQ